MARLARSEVFSPDQVAVVHVINRVVRSCFLLCTDAVTGKNYDHRKVLIERQLERLAAWFGIDLLGFSILSTHFHLILRSPPDAVGLWDDAEVARRWLMLTGKTGGQTHFDGHAKVIRFYRQGQCLVCRQNAAVPSP